MPTKYSPQALATFAKYPDFEKAVDRESKQLLKKPTDTESLELYSLFKVGIDEDIKGEWGYPKGQPTFYSDIKGNRKWAAWNNQLKAGTTPEEARERYLALVETLKEKYGFDANKDPNATS
ncbi:acyl CoA binding protein-domain-containing protein [Nemania sp. FL0916]|nr:acyl CoA binding protein-domain-containing protein [Nemania sp. FL0916]